MVSLYGIIIIVSIVIILMIDGATPTTAGDANPASSPDIEILHKSLVSSASLGPRHRSEPLGKDLQEC